MPTSKDTIPFNAFQGKRANPGTPVSVVDEADARIGRQMTARRATRAAAPTSTPAPTNAPGTRQGWASGSGAEAGQPARSDGRDDLVPGESTTRRG